MDNPIASDRNSSGHTMNWAYDGVGSKTREIRADEVFRTWRYNGMNQLWFAYDWRTNETPTANQTTAYDHDQAGNIIAIVDTKGASYQFEYDALGRKIRETYPPDASNNTSRFVHWHFDVAGNVDQYYNPAGHIQTRGYDNRNRLTVASWNGGGGATRTYAYDAASRMTSVVTGANETTVAFGYDDANRQIWEDQTLAGYPTRRVETPRDADGSRTQLNVLGGDYTLNYDYNQRNELFHLRGDDPFATFTRDVAGNVTQLKLDWALGSPSNYTYDELNRVATIDHGNATAIFQHNHYQYDNVGRQVATWRDEDGKGERFWYSATNQITDALYGANQVWTGSPTNAAKTQTYTYSADNLNRQSMTENGAPTNYVTNAMNQMTALNGQTIGYDGNFNFASIGGWHFAYDAENRLTSLENSGPRAAFVYDGLGRCVKRTIQGVTTLITYDAWNPILEWDEGGIRKAVNVYGAKADEILVRVDAVYGPMSYKRDRQGNITFVLGGSTQIIEQYTYDAFGRPTIMNGSGVVNNDPHAVSAVGNRFMFQGREYFGENGLSDFRHRFYAPSLGRFLQTDPLDLQTEGAKLTAGQKVLFSPGGSAPEAFGSSEMNLYRYCGDDAVDGSDPMGLDAEFTLMRDPYVVSQNANPRLSAGIMTITENGRFMGSMRVNTNGFYPDRRGIPAGNYVVLPKAKDGSFLKGTPAVTSPSMRDKPGATTAGHPEGAVLIHGEGKPGEPDSKACITCGPAGLKLATDVFNRNKDSTTMRVYNGPGMTKPNEIPRAIPLDKRYR